MIKLIHDDCVNALKHLEQDSIDLTVTSPPYDDLRKYKDSLEWGEHVWSVLIDELYRVTAEGGVVVWICQDKCVNGGESMTSFKQALRFGEAGFRLYDTMIWNKPSPQAPTEGRYYDVFEYMFVFSKGKPKTLNLLKDRKNKSAGSVSNKETRSCREDRRNTGKKRMVAEYSRRFNVWNIGRGRNKTSHPAVYPEELALGHIESWSNEGDVVLDPFMGSGTTGKVAVETGRAFVGVEKVREYYEISHQRIHSLNTEDSHEVIGKPKYKICPATK